MNSIAVLCPHGFMNKPYAEREIRRKYSRANNESINQRRVDSRRCQEEIRNSAGVLIEKRCSRCKLFLPIDKFGTSKRIKSGYTSDCKDCHALSERIARQNRGDDIRARDREYKNSNKDRLLKKEQVKRQLLPEVYRGYDKTRYDKVSKKVEYRIAKNFSNRVWASFRKGKGEVATVTLLGYSIEVLKKHLEYQFSDGMLWSNYGKGEGKWSIDHITPVSSFTFTSLTDKSFGLCWSLENLRPLWEKENSSKSGRILGGVELQNIVMISMEAANYARGFNYGE